MKILVCVKQVLESQDAVRLDPGADQIVTDPSAAYKMNPFDEYAVEEALQIRKKIPDSEVDAVTVGPEGATTVVRRAMGMGADHGIHIVGGEVDPDPSVIASLIARYAEGRDYGLILTGVMAEDNMQGAVGPMTAALLSVPCATAVIAEQISESRESMVVERELEGGVREVLRIELPALLSIQSGINRPRYPSLSNLLRAKGQRLESLDAETLGVLNARQGAARYSHPGKVRSATVLKGTSEEKAKGLIRILEERHFLPR